MNVKAKEIRYTRKQYMNGECTFREYYSQFVNEAVKSQVLLTIGKEALLKSKDGHLNDIPLKKWDRIRPHTLNRLHEAGDSPTLAGAVCIVKEAARQIIEEEAKRQAVERSPEDRYKLPK